jgi:hypothetical protein
MTEEQIDVRIVSAVAQYRMMMETVPNSSMLREVKEQYSDMADGGDGGFLWNDDDGKEVMCREYNYPGHPNRFFSEVRDLLGWQ